MNNLSIKGILLGLLVTIVIDIIGGIAAIPLFASSMSEEALKALNEDTGALIWSLLIGTVSTIIGGFIAARFGKLAPYKNSAVVGVIGLIAGVLLGGDAPLWFNIIGFASVIPAALLGGYLVARKNL